MNGTGVKTGIPHPKPPKPPNPNGEMGAATTGGATTTVVLVTVVLVDVVVAGLWSRVGWVGSEWLVVGGGAAASRNVGTAVRPRTGARSVIAASATAGARMPPPS
jgi:hypothetical protein